MAAEDNLRPEQFGLTQDDVARIKGHAIAGHIWSGMEDIFGDMRVSHQSAAYDKLSQRFGTENVHIDKESGDPFVEVRHGPHAMRYHGGATLNYYTHGENVDASTTYEHHLMDTADMKRRLRSWIDYTQGEE